MTVTQIDDVLGVSRTFVYWAFRRGSETVAGRRGEGDLLRGALSGIRTASSDGGSDSSAVAGGAVDSRYLSEAAVEVGRCVLVVIGHDGVAACSRAARTGVGSWSAGASASMEVHRRRLASHAARQRGLKPNRVTVAEAVADSPSEAN